MKSATTPEIINRIVKRYTPHPNLFRATHAFMQPFCAAADKPTTNSSWSGINSHRRNMGGLCSTTILTIVTADYGAVDAYKFKNLKI